MRSLTSSRPVWSASSTARAVGHVELVVGAHAPRQLEDGVEPGADPAALGALLAGALQPVDLLLDRACARRRAGVEGLQPGPVVLGQPSSPPPSPSSLRMAASCWRSRNSRWVFSMPSDTSVRMRSFSSISARASRTQATTLVSRASTSSVSSSSTLRSIDRSGHQPAVSASAPGLGDRRAAARRSARPRGARGWPPRPGGTPGPAPRPWAVTRVSSARSSRTHRARPGAGHAGADHGPVQAAHHDGADAAGQLDRSPPGGRRCPPGRSGR